MKRIISALIVFVLLLFTSCSVKIEDSIGTKEQNTAQSSGKMMTLTVIDVGQGDSILIKTPNNKFVLVDSGSVNDKDKFFKYLKKQNISKFDVVVATHPHEDHIGNLDDVIMEYNIGDVYMPKVTANTAAFRNLMEAIKSKNLKIKTAVSGVRFTLDGIAFQFLAPNSSRYDDLNNYSAVLKASYGNKSFLLMGDAEKLSEGEILASGADVRADVIKIGHHGSTSSSSKKFITAASPEYAAISCGKQNDYGHPHKETLNLLSSVNIKLYRTDIDGTILFATDGKNLKISTNK